MGRCSTETLSYSVAGGKRMKSGKCLISQFNVDHSTCMPSYVLVLRDFAQLQLLNYLSRFLVFVFPSATHPTLPLIPQL